ncbi:unnamed protein product, partial [Rhizophagus irregularis]
YSKSENMHDPLP